MFCFCLIFFWKRETEKGRRGGQRASEKKIDNQSRKQRELSRSASFRHTRTRHERRERAVTTRNHARTIDVPWRHSLHRAAGGNLFFFRVVKRESTEEREAVQFFFRRRRSRRRRRFFLPAATNSSFFSVQFFFKTKKASGASVRAVCLISSLTLLEHRSVTREPRKIGSVFSTAAWFFSFVSAPVASFFLFFFSFSCTHSSTQPTRFSNPTLLYRLRRRSSLFHFFHLKNKTSRNGSRQEGCE